MKKHYTRVLTIAGSDCSGGAGVQADLKTFAAHGCYGMSVLTALTAQNTTGVRAIHPVPAPFIREQIAMVFEDVGVDAVKIGMLHSAEVIEAVAEELARWSPRHVVVDPVMVAKGGSKLLEDSAVEALRTHLVPLATVITPNLPEGAVLLGRSGGEDDMASSYREMEADALRLSRLGPQAVFLKGGHLAGPESPDCLVIRGEAGAEKLPGARIDTKNGHGTGCTISSAIAGNLALGYPLREAIGRAKGYLSAALRAGAAYELGHGHGPVHHFFDLWKEPKR